MKYESVEQYLRNYSIKEFPYDPNGAIHLLKAIVQNMEKHFIDVDFEAYAASISKREEAFLRKLIDSIPSGRKLDSESNDS